MIDVMDLFRDVKKDAVFGTGYRLCRGFGTETQRALLTLWLLTMMVAQTSGTGECVQWYTPLDNIIKESLVNPELVWSWSDLDMHCGDAHFGHSLLHRGYSSVTQENECWSMNAPRSTVPLRMRKELKIPYWVNGFGISDEVVNSTDDLVHMEPNALEGLGNNGIYNITTSLWSFTSEDNLNTICILCEMLRRKDLRIPFESDLYYNDSNTRYNVTVDSNGEMSVAEIQRDLAIALAVPESSITQLQVDETAPTFRKTTALYRKEFIGQGQPRLNSELIEKVYTREDATVGIDPFTGETSLPPSKETPAFTTIGTNPFTGETSLPPTTETPAFTTIGTNPFTGETSLPPTTEAPAFTTIGTNPFTGETSLPPTTEAPDFTTPDAPTTREPITPGGTTPTTDETFPTSPPGTTPNGSTPPGSFPTSPPTPPFTTPTTPITSATTTPTTTSTTLSTTTLTSSITPQGEMLYFRVTVPDSHDPLPPSEMETPATFNISSIDNVGSCPAESVTDQQNVTHLWPETKAGKVAIKRNSINLVLTARECIWRQYEEHAYWSTPSEWTESWAPCQPINNNDTPEATLDNAEDFLESLVDLPVLSKQLEEIASVVNDVLKLDESFLTQNSNSTTYIVQTLATILSNMVLVPGSDVAEAVESDLAIVVSDVNVKGETVVGVSLSKSQNESGMHVLRTYRSGDEVDDTSYEVRTILDTSLVRLNSRLAFTIFSDGKAFPVNLYNVDKVNSHVIDILLLNITENEAETVFPDDMYIDIAFNPVEVSRDIACAYWNFLTSNWSTDGCQLVNSTDNSSGDTCRCEHLTHFAEIITGGNSNISEIHQFVLDIISIVGCVVSLLALSAIALTAICFPRWRREKLNKILLHMSAALALNMVAFLLIASVPVVEGGAGCIVMGVLLHYSVLACFSWMLVLSVLQFLRLSTMLGSKGITHLLLKTSLFGWAVPFIPVLLLLIIDPNLYAIETGTGVTRDFCYPTGLSFYLAVLAPIVILIAINIIIFVMTLLRIYSCCSTDQISSKSRHGITDKTVAARRLKTSIILFFTLGLTWTFGILARNLVFTYMFCIVATMQGLVLFVCFLVLEKKSSGYWKAAVESHLVTSKTSYNGSSSTRNSSLSLSHRSTTNSSE